MVFENNGLKPTIQLTYVYMTLRWTSILDGE